MAKIGMYSYPDVSVPEAVKIAKVIYDFPSHSMSVKLLAEKLGISARGGWTGMILYSLKRYGFAEGRGTLRTTDMGAKIVNPVSLQEFTSAKELVFNKIEFWVRIRKDYGEKAPSSEFCGYLVDKLGIDRIIAQSKFEKVAKIYTESLYYCFPPTTSSLSYEGGRRAEPTMENTQSRPSSEPTSDVPCDVVNYGSSDDYNIWVKRDQKSIEFAESQIEAIKAWLKHQKAKLQAEKIS
jgi:hypothetical protein